MSDSAMFDLIARTDPFLKSIHKVACAACKKKMVKVIENRMKREFDAFGKRPRKKKEKKSLLRSV